MFAVKSCEVLLRTKINYSCLVRWASATPNVSKKPASECGVPKSWSAVVTEAEKVVGYPTSFLNLRWLLSDEFANIGMYVKKIIGTGHPILLTVRNLLLQNNAPSWGLVVLLVSKAAGLNKQFPESDKDLGAGLLHSQRVLAEVTEMLRTSNKIHRSLYHVSNSTEYKEDMFYGNKIALLCGDYLLSSSFNELAKLKNQEMNEVMSTALRDMSEAEFMGIRDNQNRPVPSRRNKSSDSCQEFEEQIDLNSLCSKDVIGDTKAEWTLRSMLVGGSLLAKACKCTLKLAKHGNEVQNNGYKIGRHIALAWQAHKDLALFKEGKTGPFSLVSAPVLFHLDHDPSLYTMIECATHNLDDINYTYLRSAIVDGPGIEETKNVCTYHAKEALRYINTLPDSETRLALENIVTPLL